MSIFSGFFSGKTVIVAAAGAFLLVAAGVTALPMGEREIAHFEREALRAAREVFQLPGQLDGSDYVIEMNNQIIHDTRIKRAKVVVSQPGQRELARLVARDFDFSFLKQTEGIEVEALVEVDAIRELITREINRVPSGRRIFNSFNLAFGDNRVEVSGEIDLQKVPGNPFLFLPQQMSPFSVAVTVKTSGGQIIVEILEGQMNNQPLTPELKKMFHDWLNPLWDFNALPYSAGLSFLQINSTGARVRGSLFR